MSRPTSRNTPALLAAGEPPAFEVINAAGGSRAVLVCDHASNRVPRRLGTLGLDPDSLAEHIAWDPGAADVARQLSARLDAPLVLSGYSRLVIDCNRPVQHPESIAEQSAGVRVPGNRGLTAAQRRMRIASLFHPYHTTIARLLDGRSRGLTQLISIHSFTPVLAGTRRPWHVGVCYGTDRRLAAPLLRALAQEEGITVGDNAPYPIEDDIDYTLPVHGERRGLPCVMIEIRQDLIRTKPDAASWADRLAAAYRKAEG